MGKSPLKVGIIGGSGFYSLEGLTEKKEVQVTTEFGDPSDSLVTGKVGNVDCVVLARHGRDHRFNPTEVNYRANIRAMQKLEVTHILAATACGSLKEELRPGDLCILDSFIDRTTKRHQTFHDQSTPSNFGTVCHIPTNISFCPKTRDILIECCKNLGLCYHQTGTAVTIEGPRFSSKAESHLFKSWGCDIINMTTVPEVVLAAEAGISYASVAMVTDYDCWRDSGEAVDVAQVIAVLNSNIDKVKKVFLRAIDFMENNWSQSEVEDTVNKNKERAKSSVMH